MIDRFDGANAFATSRIQALIVDLVREVHGDDGIERRPRYGGDQHPEPAPAPLAGLQAADWVVKQAGQELRRHVRAAREAGHSWERIGQALDMRPVAGRTVAEAALRALRRPTRGMGVSRPDFTWRCTACDRVISDRGPYESHPDDNQRGHATSCSRLAAELDRCRASWGDASVAEDEQGSDR